MAARIKNHKQFALRHRDEIFIVQGFTLHQLALALTLLQVGFTQMRKLGFVGVPGQ